MEAQGLSVAGSGFFKGYDSTCKSDITNEFATAAYRFGHSLVRTKFSCKDSNYNTVGGWDLNTLFFNPDVMRDNGTCLLRGLAGDAGEGSDRFMTDAIHHKLFEEAHKAFSGLDLPALNIQRGRDHGLHPYNSYREQCGVFKANSFSDLLITHSAESVDALKLVYDKVDDIDLFTGIMTETRLTDALLGPVGVCLLAEQFERLKKCDRFFYENEDSSVGFTQDQLNEIRKVTLARIVCENTPGFDQIQPRVFDLTSDSNQLTPCSQLNDMDMSKWKDERRRPPPPPRG